MPKAKVQAFLKEFPWIQDILDGCQTRNGKLISRVYVSMVEPSLWEYHPREFYIPGDLFSDTEHHQEWMFLLDEKHKPFMCEKKTESLKKYIFFGPRAIKSQMSPAVAMNSKFSLGSFIMKNFGGEGQTKIDAIRFILSYYSNSGTAIIYKLPKGISLLTLMEEGEKMEREKFRRKMDL